MMAKSKTISQAKSRRKVINQEQEKSNVDKDS